MLNTDDLQDADDRIKAYAQKWWGKFGKIMDSLGQTWNVDHRDLEPAAPEVAAPPAKHIESSKANREQQKARGEKQVYIDADATARLGLAETLKRALKC